MIATVVILFLGIGLHEYAHCKFADMAGDPTPAYYGRVTLDLTKHFEISGVIMMIITSLVGFGIGWGKASPINPNKMRNPRVDTFVAVAAGPVSNLCQATIYALMLRIAFHVGLLQELPTDARLFVGYLLVGGVAINLALAIFNLIPFGPLDGHWLVGLLLPEKPRYYWFRFNRQVGMMGLFLVVFLLQARGIRLTQGPVNYVFHLLTGVTWDDAIRMVIGGRYG